MYYLALLFPALQGRRLLPLSRDQMMLIMAATNEVFLAIDIYLAHNLNGTIRPREWIPIVFGLVAGALLLFAGLIALRNRPLASVIATVVLLTSIAVGLLGAYFHIVRAIRPAAELGDIGDTARYADMGARPIVGPLIFSLVGLWGVSAAWDEEPPDSGRLETLGRSLYSICPSKKDASLPVDGLSGHDGYLVEQRAGSWSNSLRKSLVVAANRRWLVCCDRIFQPRGDQTTDPGRHRLLLFGHGVTDRGWGDRLCFACSI